MSTKTENPTPTMPFVKMPFFKMNGLGNDFVVIDMRQNARTLDQKSVQALADRKLGIGCDQLIAIEAASGKADANMRIWNADGTEVEACGNAARCVGRLLAEELGRDEVRIDSPGGTLIATTKGGSDITVDMGVPKFEWDEIPLRAPMDTRRLDLQLSPIDAQVFHAPAAVNVGNPHCVFFVDDIAAHDLAAFGPIIEHHRLFPERINVELAQILDRHTIRMRVWERGTGITRACGTGACATAVSAARLGHTSRNVSVELDGGVLGIEWRESDDHILMTGPTALNFSGELGPDVLGEAP